MKRIFLDTNILIYIFRTNLNLEQLIESIGYYYPVINQSIKQEFEKIIGNTSFIDAFECFSCTNKGDYSILETCLEYKIPCISNDRELVRKLKSKQVKCYILSKTKRLLEI